MGTGLLQVRCSSARAASCTAWLPSAWAPWRLAMVLATTEPGVQVYDGRNSPRPGHGDYEGLAIEAQGWPDAPNQPGFPPIDLAAGALLTQITEWRFERS